MTRTPSNPPADGSRTLSWNDKRMLMAYSAVTAVLDSAPEPETYLRVALENALSNIEYADELLAKREKGGSQ